MIEVSKKCIGCNKCVPVCPFAAINMIDKKAVMNEACTLCGVCVQICPVQAITITREEASARDLSGYKGVWVYVELTENGEKTQTRKIKQVTFELLSAGRRLADELGQDLCAVLLADKNHNYEKELGAYGADKVYLVEHDELFEYNTDIFSTVIVSLVTRHKPSIMLYGATIQGRDLAPRVASTLYVGLTADCTALAIKDGLLLQSRPAFGGNIMADILAPSSRPQMSTVRPNVMKLCEPVHGRSSLVVRESAKLDKSLRRVKVLERKIAHDAGSVRIENSRVIVSGGRGMKTKEKFRQLEELSKLLGGVVGASRAAVDLGFKEKTHQVGQSGTTVSPKLYLSFGISGAVQHIVGMKASDVIIAVNKDPNAPIFNVAKYGIVGDAHEIVPKLIEALKKQK
ncbi:MAG: electron transfer flavoprotein subunit alpha [Elusimicrobia bacterium GWA2_61_42]|nr:MAG: electron transfer flavoprotein subunit alpha [Elusimicrobia bacterium GWA2_61_42]OGR75326.1 MAG: electron transfer flavoprotein subunit alpha [Elusimicrobia bacterium GWC2_61_25]